MTRTRAYNGSCQLWKDEDIEYVRNLDVNKNLHETNPPLYKESVRIYLKAREEYGDKFQKDSENFRGDSPESIFCEFGFDITDIEDEMAYTELDISNLPKNKKYPVKFPVITIIGGGEDLETLHIYPDTFDTPSKIPDYGWLETNINKFWKEGKGTIWKV
jgi:hypothetical protein